MALTTPQTIHSAIAKEIAERSLPIESTFSIDDIAVLCLKHEQLGMRKYPQYPDQRKVAVCVIGSMSKDGGLIKVGQDLYRLGQAPKKPAHREGVTHNNRRFLDRMQDTEAASQLRKGENTSRLTMLHALQFFGARRIGELSRRYSVVVNRIASIRLDDPSIHAEELNFLQSVVTALEPQVEKSRRLCGKSLTKKEG